MLYHITHRTTYQYTQPVSVCHNLVRLAPRQLPNQAVGEYELFVGPEPVIRSRRFDYFGNQVDYFTIQNPHQELVITSESRVNVAPVLAGAREDLPWESVVQQLGESRSSQAIEAFHFALPTDRTANLAPLRDYAAFSFNARRPILNATRDLVARIHADFIFDPHATTVHASTCDLLSLQRGVCQDFAHFAIGCLRAQGLAARYVSGYICTEPPPGSPRLIGADASHAWFSVYTGPTGWVDFDPTNNLPVSTDHVTVAWGRDYADICPIQGVFVGGGQHSMHVAVDVVPISETEPLPDADKERA